MKKCSKEKLSHSIWGLLFSAPLWLPALVILLFIIKQLWKREPDLWEVKLSAEILAEKEYPDQDAVVWCYIDVPTKGTLISVPAKRGQERFLRITSGTVSEVMEREDSSAYGGEIYEYVDDVRDVIKNQSEVFQGNTGSIQFSKLHGNRMYAFVVWNELISELVDDSGDKYFGNNVGIYFIYDYETKEILYAQRIQMDNFCFQSVGIVLPENTLPEGQ